MASTKGSTTKRATLAAASFVGLFVLLWLFMWWRSRPPQMGANEEVFKTADALFTAITARDEKLVADCDQRLHTLRDVGKLPLAASTYLDNIVGKARANRWESAAQSLYDFLRAQRREGADNHHIRKKAKEGPREAKK